MESEMFKLKSSFILVTSMNAVHVLIIIHVHAAVNCVFSIIYKENNVVFSRDGNCNEIKMLTGAFARQTIWLHIPRHDYGGTRLSRIEDFARVAHLL
jgi:hypothetical protein